MCERCGCSVTSQQNAEQLQKNNNLGGKCKMAKWVYMFTEGNANMRNLLGGKGANLAEMTNLGLPVPQIGRAHV